MHPRPADSETVKRMRAAHRRAQAALSVTVERGGPAVWGWRGRTLSRPVTGPAGPAWLRLACLPRGQRVRTFWDGALAAEEKIPAAVPRPRLRRCRDWCAGGWEYRAELFDRLDARFLSPTVMLTSRPVLPRGWWAELRAALDAVAAVETTRVTLDQHYLDWAMPRFLGPEVDPAVGQWATAHGDLHWANLSAPRLQIVDWEGWGRAPVGYDVAVLHSYSLRVPAITAQIHRAFASVLDTPAGRFAELVALTELLHATARGEHLALLDPLRHRVAHLLGRPVPHPTAEAARR